MTLFLLLNGDLYTANTTISQLTNDFGDFNISGSPISITSDDGSSGASETGGYVILNSRLIPETINYPMIFLLLNDYQYHVLEEIPIMRKNIPIKMALFFDVNYLKTPILSFPHFVYI